MSLVNKRHIVSKNACKRDTTQLNHEERKINKNTANQAIIPLDLLLRKINNLLSSFIWNLFAAKIKQLILSLKKNQQIIVKYH